MSEVEAAFAAGYAAAQHLQDHPVTPLVPSEPPAQQPSMPADFDDDRGGVT